MKSARLFVGVALTAALLLASCTGSGGVVKQDPKPAGGNNPSAGTDTAPKK